MNPRPLVIAQRATELLHPRQCVRTGLEDRSTLRLSRDSSRRRLVNPSTYVALPADIHYDRMFAAAFVRFLRSYDPAIPPIPRSRLIHSSANARTARPAPRGPEPPIAVVPDRRVLCHTPSRRGPREILRNSGKSAPLPRRPVLSTIRMRSRKAWSLCVAIERVRSDRRSRLRPARRRHVLPLVPLASEAPNRCSSASNRDGGCFSSVVLETFSTVYGRSWHGRHLAFLLDTSRRTRRSPSRYPRAVAIVRGRRGVVASRSEPRFLADSSNTTPSAMPTTAFRSRDEQDVSHIRCCMSFPRHRGSGDLIFC